MYSLVNRHETIFDRNTKQKGRKPRHQQHNFAQPDFPFDRLNIFLADGLYCLYSYALEGG